jgi:hypothetical protein
MESDIDGRERGSACVITPPSYGTRHIQKGSRFREIICLRMIRSSFRSLQLQEDFFGLDATQFRSELCILFSRWLAFLISLK